MKPPADPTVLDPARASKPSLDGADFLLAILAGLAVGAVIASASRFLTFILEPFSLRMPPAPPKLGPPAWFGLLVFLIYLVNVVRQMHGLGIVIQDDEYQDIVGRHLSRARRALAFVSQVFVIVSAAMLVVLVTTDSNSIFRRVMGSAGDPTTQLLLVHALTVFSYLIWDLVALQEGVRHLVTSTLGHFHRRPTGGAGAGTQPELGERRTFLEWEASEYYEFVRNWTRLALLALLALLAWLLLFILVKVKLIHFSPPTLGAINLWTLAVLASGYTIADYFCNANFYFRKFTLPMQTRLKTEVSMKKQRRIVLGAIGAAVVLITVFAVMAGCSRDTVRLQLKWIVNAGFAGDIVAEQKGLWKGLDVDVLPGALGTDAIKAVTSGAAEFGVATGDQLLMAREAGAPIVAIALVYQENPLAWIVRRSAGIKKPADLKGRKVGLTFIDDEALFQAMIKKEGLSDTDLTTVSVKFDPSPFLGREIDAFPVFRNTQGVELAMTLQAQGDSAAFVGPAQVGIISYSNLYFTREDFAEKHPETVTAFVQGVVSGWKYARDHPEEAAELVKRRAKDEDTPLAVVTESVRETNRLVQPDNTFVIGEMTPAGWQSTQNVLLEARLLKARQLIADVYTNEFVEKIH